MKSGNKKLFVLVLSLVFAIGMMAGCGGGEGSGGGETAEENNLGKYVGDQIYIMEWEPAESLYDLGENYIELKSGNKAVLCLDGDPVYMDWKIEGEDLTMTAEGETCTGIIRNGVIKTLDFFGTEMQMTFIKEGADESSADTAQELMDEIFEETENPDADAGYGKTTEDADGNIDFDTLKAGYAWLDGETSNGERPTYEEIRSHFGDINPKKAHEGSWETDFHVYRWQTEDDSDFLLLSFRVAEDGTETWNNSSWSDGIAVE